MKSLNDPDEFGPFLDITPPAMLVPQTPAPDETIEIARALGLDIDDEKGLIANDVAAMRSDGIEPQTSSLERQSWRYIVASMYATMGGDPVDYGDEATAAIALIRAHHSLDIALHFFPEDHPLRSEIERVFNELNQVASAHWVYCGLDDAGAFDDHMDSELRELYDPDY